MAPNMRCNCGGNLNLPSIKLSCIISFFAEIRNRLTLWIFIESLDLVAKRIAQSSCMIGALRSGGIAQLGERLHGMQEVSGSIPLTSTSCGEDVLSGSPSSRGLGHHPFTVGTGVRIP